ncbi:effector-associated domain 2-containing protein [Phytohabitans kaempferiae]|uniref:SEFIR domain-containing protein n=1 Tax=Phytohabitans kaempferiae TaxID=1620943 RepID=A0ABV6MEZ5_9ACTN
MSDAGRSRRVFVSYAHESPAHIEQVRQLWTLLLENGVDARLDLPATAERQDWPLWMMEQLRHADYVVVVASPAYRRRADGEAAADEGRGVQFEGALLREQLYADRPTWTRKILPVILPGQSEDGIPIFLGPATGTSYPVKELSATGLEELVRVITGQPAVVAPPLAPPPALPPAPPLPAPPAPPPPAPPPAAAPTAGSPLDELSAIADAFGELPEFGSAQGRHQILLLLPPQIRGAINDMPNARMHTISIVQTCARFGPAGQAALLAILRAALPAGDPAVQRATDLITAATLFD